MGFLSRIFGIEKPASDGDGAAGLSRLEDIEPLRRACWLPVVEDGDGAVTGSKFAGVPYLAEGEAWPVCPNCGNAIQLFLQLNSDELPEESGKPWGDGLLQFFYCTNKKPACELDCAAWSEFAKSVLIRVVPAGDALSAYSEIPVIGAFPPKRIVGWTQTDDLPQYWEEMQDLGVHLSEADAEELSETYPREGEKLLGWPYWVQGKEYPNCPECGSEMQLVFQIDSEQSLPYMFGDAGAGHITQCPEHRTVPAFRWACS